MSIIPARIAEQTARVDRNYSLYIGISAGITAMWCLYRVFWSVYLAVTFSGLGWSPVSLVFPLVMWGVIGVVAGFASFAFLTRYSKQT
jgi:hypothetical protein